MDQYGPRIKGNVEIIPHSPFEIKKKRISQFRLEDRIKSKEVSEVL